MQPITVAEYEATVRDLRREIIALRAALAAQGAKLENGVVQRADWAVGLRPQQIALCLALKTAYPAPVEKWELLEALPGYADDRGIKLVAIVVFQTRATLGKAAIENVHGVGYRLSPEGYAKIDPANQAQLKAA